MKTRFLSRLSVVTVIALVLLLPASPARAEAPASLTTCAGAVCS